MAHLKRQEVPKTWPVARKGSSFVVRPSFNLENGIPILVILRDILKIAENRKEAKNSIHQKKVLLNNKAIKSEKNPALLFDVISIVPAKKNYRLSLSKSKKFCVDEIKESEANTKVSKIINKKTLKGKKIQLNLIDGRNFLSDIKCNINDSVLINFKENKIEKCLKLKEGSEAVIFSGKHLGVRGIIEEVDVERKIVKIKTEGEKINVLIKQIMVVEQ